MTLPPGTRSAEPRDPYPRVDILANSRRVRVELNGVTVAESGQPRILFETGLVPRPGHRSADAWPTASTPSRRTRRMLPLASFPHSARDQPRSSSSANRAG